MQRPAHQTSGLVKVVMAGSRPVERLRSDGLDEGSLQDNCLPPLSGRHAAASFARRALPVGLPTGRAVFSKCWMGVMAASTIRFEKEVIRTIRMALELRHLRHVTTVPNFCRVPEALRVR